ncbi:MAG: NAD(P)-binding domain-containing protein [Pseudomonadota bacterium]
MNILVIGAGRMGGALLNGWANGDGPSARIFALDRNIASALVRYNVMPVCSAYDFPQDFRPDMIVIPTKPQKVIGSILKVDGFVGARTALVSVAAGVSIETIEA